MTSAVLPPVPAWLRKRLADEQRAKVELSQTATGGTQACVKVYGPDPEAAMLEAIRLYDLLVERYRQGGSPA